MTTKTKVTVLSTAVAVCAFILGPIIWPNPADGYMPTSGQLPFFMAISAFEAIAFGIGVSFLVFGWPVFRSLRAQHPHEPVWAFLAADWLLISWWPHDNWHRGIGHDVQGLLYIEYAFHVTMMIAGLIIVSYLYKKWKAGGAGYQN